MKERKDYFKSIHISIELTAEEINFWNKYTGMKDIPVSGGIKLALDDFYMKLKKNKKLPIELREYLEDYNRKQETKRLSEKINQENQYFLFYSNTYKKIIRQAKEEYQYTGKINMKGINHIIDNSLKIFETFPEHIKLIIKKDMERLEELRNLDQVLNKLKKRNAVSKQKTGD